MNAVPNSDGLIHSVDKVELPGSTEGVLIMLREILAKPFIQKVNMEVGGHITVEWYREASDSLLDPSAENAEDVFSRIELVNSDFRGSPQEIIFSALLDLSLEGYLNTHILCGDLYVFKKWIGLSGAVKLSKLGEDEFLFLGAALKQTPHIPSDSVILGGSNVSMAKMSDIIYGIRILMEENNGT